MSDRMSGYREGETLSQVAWKWHRGLLDDTRLNSESAYGMSSETVVTLTLAGGGPSFVARFGFDSAEVERFGSPWECEPLWAETVYGEPFESPVTNAVPSDEVERLWLDFTRDPSQVEGGDDE